MCRYTMYTHVCIWYLSTVLHTSATGFCSLCKNKCSLRCMIVFYLHTYNVHVAFFSSFSFFFCTRMYWCAYTCTRATWDGCPGARWWDRFRTLPSPWSQAPWTGPSTPTPSSRPSLATTSSWWRERDDN